MVENEAKTEWGRIGISGSTIDGLEAGRQLPTSVDKSLDSAQLAR
jgi:hypothetical protein